eukprot:7367563-Prymnesium_polylepis.1
MHLDVGCLEAGASGMFSRRSLLFLEAQVALRLRVLQAFITKSRDAACAAALAAASVAPAQRLPQQPPARHRCGGLPLLVQPCQHAQHQLPALQVQSLQHLPTLLDRAGCLSAAELTARVALRPRPYDQPLVLSARPTNGVVGIA